MIDLDGYEETTDPQVGDFVLVGETMCEIKDRLPEGKIAYLNSIRLFLETLLSLGCKCYRKKAPRRWEFETRIRAEADRWISIPPDFIVGSNIRVTVEQILP